MELFTVSVMSASDEEIDFLRECLSGELADLHSSDEAAGISLTPADDIGFKGIVCAAKLPGFRLVEDGPLVYRKAAAAFARYIVSTKEKTLIRAIIRKQFGYESDEDIHTIEKYCGNLLFGGAGCAGDADSADTEMLKADCERRKNKIAAEIELYLSEQTRIHLDGFVTFRLASYWQELREIVAFAVDEYVMDKQYQEFISLLKYFVRMQEVKLPIVHVLHKGGTDFALCDEGFKLLESAPADRIVAEMLESEMNMEDMIVSTLITFSPQQIVIHTRHPELPVIRTLETIFEQRVRLCVDCADCAVHFKDAKKAEQTAGAKAAPGSRIGT